MEEEEIDKEEEKGGKEKIMNLSDKSLDSDDNDNNHDMRLIKFQLTPNTSWKYHYLSF